MELVEEDNDYIKFQETTSFEIILDEKKDFNYRFATIIPYDVEKKHLTFYNLDEFKINNTVIDKGKVINSVNKNKRLNVYGSYTIKNKKIIKVEKTETKQYSLKENPYKLRRAICIYQNFSLNFNYPKNIKLNFVDVGVLGKWTENKDNKPKNYNVLMANYDGLIFKNQGFLIIFNKC